MLLAPLLGLLLVTGAAGARFAVEGDVGAQGDLRMAARDWSLLLPLSANGAPDAGTFRPQPLGHSGVDILFEWAMPPELRVETRTVSYLQLRDSDESSAASKQSAPPRTSEIDVDSARAVRVQCHHACMVHAAAGESGRLDVAIGAPEGTSPKRLPAPRETLARVELPTPYFYQWSASSTGVNLALQDLIARADALSFTGDFVIAVWDAQVSVDKTDGESLDWESGERAVSENGPVRQVTRTVVLLRGHGEARLTHVPAAGGLLTATDPEYAVRGGVAITDASGTLRLGNQRMPLQRSSFVSHGEFVVRPTCEADEGVNPPVAPGPSGAASCTYEIEGRATDLYVDGRPVGKYFMTARAAFGLTLASLALLLSRLLPPVRLMGLPLYSRIARDRILDHPQRLRVYECISQQPGIHFSALRRAVDLPSGSVWYHVRVLERASLVVTRASSGYRTLWLSHCAGSPEEERQAVALNKSSARAIASRLLESPGLSQKDLAVAHDLPQTTVSYHLVKLEGLGLVRAQTDRSSARPCKRYFPTDRLRDALRSEAGESRSGVGAGDGTPGPRAAP